jgi:hypothetical protein
VDENSCGFCGKPLSYNSKSLYFCDPTPASAGESGCQIRWQANLPYDPNTFTRFAYESIARIADASLAIMAGMWAWTLQTWWPEP